MSAITRTFLRFLVCTIILFIMSYFSRNIAIDYADGHFFSKPLGSVITGFCILLNFPLWILGKGWEILRLEDNFVIPAILLNSGMYGLLLTYWLSNTKKLKPPPPRRSVE